MISKAIAIVASEFAPLRGSIPVVALWDRLLPFLISTFLKTESAKKSCPEILVVGIGIVNRSQAFDINTLVELHCDKNVAGGR